MRAIEDGSVKEEEREEDVGSCGDEESGARDEWELVSEDMQSSGDCSSMVVGLLGVARAVLLVMLSSVNGGF